MNMKNILLISCVSLFLSATLWAQGNIKDNLYSADRVMENREKIDLSKKQADEIKKIHNETAGAFQTLKWDLDYEQALLDSLVAMENPNARQVENQFDKVVALEKELKKMRLMSMVSIKNILTVEQVKKLKGNTFNQRYFSVNPSFFKLENEPVNIGNVKVIRSGKKGQIRRFKTDSVIYHGSVSTPLYVVKKGGTTQYIENLSSVDVNNISKIEVFKGATAVSKYGEKAKNGVIVITKKK